MTAASIRQMFSAGEVHSDLKGLQFEAGQDEMHHGRAFGNIRGRHLLTV
jgi:hypothetical protein